ncbi:MAG: Rrf2 family transcriptional regulator [Cyanobacteriota bacterium]|nr:Rrf2 family transcriptional regulator [Cyanobacteriota bacterium]
MISRAAIQTIKALLELSHEPARWRSVSQLATAQALPAPHLEQLLLRLRRAGVLEARRGRQGGYRLAAPPEELSLGRILAAAGAWPGTGGRPSRVGAGAATAEPDPATEQVADLLRQRLARAVERELDQLTLAELLFDLRSARAGLSEEGGLMLG